MSIVAPYSVYHLENFSWLNVEDIQNVKNAVTEGSKKRARHMERN